METRRKAALNLLEIARVHTAGKLEEDPQDKPLNEWTLEELVGFIARTEREINAAAVDGEAAHVD